MSQDRVFVRGERPPLIVALEALEEIVETYMNDPGQRKALVGDVSELLTTTREAALDAAIRLCVGHEDLSNVYDVIALAEYIRSGAIPQLPQLPQLPTREDTPL